MAKGLYIGVASKARKIKNVYIGIGGKARRVLKGYIGVAGKARLFYVKEWTFGHSTATNLQEIRYEMGATTVGNYALFAGGYNGYSSNNYVSNVVDTYNTSLTHSTATSLSNAREGLASSTIGNYALFGGGKTRNINGYASTKIDTYNTSLTKSTATDLSTARSYLAATTVGNYALFGGGTTNNYKEIDTTDNTHTFYLSSATVDTYNTSLTKSKATDLSTARSYLAATTVGSYALFGGGFYYKGKSYSESGYYSPTVDTYNTSLTKSTANNLSNSRRGIGATAVGNYALFAYGTYNNSRNKIYYISTIDVYNSSLTKSNISSSNIARGYVATTTLGKYALLGGGSYTTGQALRTALVETCDSSLTMSTIDELSVERTGVSATTLGSYALFAGGRGSGSGNTCLNTVDVYTLS